MHSFFDNVLEKLENRPCKCLKVLDFDPEKSYEPCAQLYQSGNE